MLIKRFFFFFFLFFLGIYFFGDLVLSDRAVAALNALQNATHKKISNSSSNSEISTNSTSADKQSSTALALLLKTIQLTQGENGAELWRLNAQAASMEHHEDSFLVESPKLIYMMPPDNKEMHVEADRGNINQKDHILQFIDNVRASYVNSKIEGSLLVYNGSSKTMTFPHGGVFHDSKAYGSANVFTWLLDSGIIDATGNVDITFTSTTE